MSKEMTEQYILECENQKVFKESFKTRFIEYLDKNKKLITPLYHHVYSRMATDNVSGVALKTFNKLNVFKKQQCFIQFHVDEINDKKCIAIDLSYDETFQIKERLSFVLTFNDRYSIDTIRKTIRVTNESIVGKEFYHEMDISDIMKDYELYMLYIQKFYQHVTELFDNDERSRKGFMRVFDRLWSDIENDILKLPDIDNVKILMSVFMENIKNTNKAILRYRVALFHQNKNVAIYVS